MENKFKAMVKRKEKCMKTSKCHSKKPGYHLWTRAISGPCCCLKGMNVHVASNLRKQNHSPGRVEDYKSLS